MIICPGPFVSITFKRAITYVSSTIIIYTGMYDAVPRDTTSVQLVTSHNNTKTDPKVNEGKIIMYNHNVMRS